MNIEIAKKWIEALRSGKYEQSRGTLKTFSGYCYLGVLYDIHKNQTQEGEWIIAQDGNYRYKTKSEESRFFLPEEVVKWAGVKKCNPYFTKRRKNAENTDEKFMKKISLSHLNDNYSNFHEIAKIIEKYQEEL
jgi:hypothetical protein